MSKIYEKSDYKFGNWSNAICLVMSLAVILSSPVAYSCGNEVAGLQMGDKVLAIEMSEPSVGMQKHSVGMAVDDDGMLAAALVASYCNQRFDAPEVHFSESQDSCAREAQRKAHVDYSLEITYSYSGTGDSTVLTLLKNSCNLDLKTLFQIKKNQVQKEPVTCAPKAKGIAARAAKRMHEYAVSLKDGSKMKRLAASSQVKAQLVDSIGKKEEALDEMARIMAIPNLTRKDFDPWALNFSKLLQDEQFQVVKSLDQVGKDSPVMQPMETILMDMNAVLPGLQSSMCGKLMTDDAFNKLASGTWKPASDSTSKAGQDTGAQVHEAR